MNAVNSNTTLEKWTPKTDRGYVMRDRSLIILSLIINNTFNQS